MNTRIKHLVSVTSLVALLGAGCAPANAPAGAPEGNAPSKSPVVNQGCNHPYFPLATGYSVTYASQGPSTSSTYTMSVDSFENDSAVLAYAFADSETTVTQRISCAGGHIVSEGYLDLGSAMGGKGFSFNTNQASGEWLPKEPVVGSEWDSAYSVTMTAPADSGLPEFLQNVDSDVTMRRKAVGTEQVTVPAGTYTALKVETETSMRSDNAQVPLNTTITSTEYWVKGVGMVRSVGEGLTIEATAIELP